MPENRNAYMERRERSAKTGRVIGLSLVCLTHICAFALLSVNGLSYIYPPPEESTFLLDFSTEVPDIQTKPGKEPVSETVDKTKPVELVKKSESPIEESTPNRTQESAKDDFGDVPTPAPEPETPKLDPRASFPGMNKKPSRSTTPHTAEKATETFRDGQGDGNAQNASADGKPNAHVEGRKVVGDLAIPKFNEQIGGKVVVKIWVDIYGKVKQAEVDASGTTVDNKTLWTEARNAAMRTHFSKLNNITETTPELQEGHIIYYFKLK